MALKDLFRRFKPAYTFYNYYHHLQLRHIETQYKKLGLKKKYYAPVSSQDFEGITPPFTPWLDERNARDVLPFNETFQTLPSAIQKELLEWSNKGYAILKDFFTATQVDTINEEVQQLIQKGTANYQRNSDKIMFAVRQSEKLKETVDSLLLQKILQLLLGKKVQLFQSINFEKGSEQATHSDSIHMTTFPQGYLIAVWIALEDIQAGSGELHYYPSSHKLPYVMSKDFDSGNTKWWLGADAYPKYEQHIALMLQEQNLEKKTFLARKGDILIWHGNLLHGGEPITQPEITRKSMVLHYYAKDVVCYHDITQRPALFCRERSIKRYKRRKEK